MAASSSSGTNQRNMRPASLINGTIGSRGPEPRAPLPWRTCSLPNRTQLRLDVGQVESAGLIHPQQNSAINRQAA
jgi:hypothetical protein